MLGYSKEKEQIAQECVLFVYKQNQKVLNVENININVYTFGVFNMPCLNKRAEVK